MTGICRQAFTLKGYTTPTYKASCETRPCLSSTPRKRSNLVWSPGRSRYERKELATLLNDATILNDATVILNDHPTPQNHRAVLPSATKPRGSKNPRGAWAPSSLSKAWTAELEDFWLAGAKATAEATREAAMMVFMFDIR
jgi:hypothetical protein